MKKIAPLFFILLSAFSTSSNAQEGMPLCHQQNQFSILNAPVIKPFMDIQNEVSVFACDESSLFDVNFLRVDSYLHDRLHCDEVALCSQNVVTAEFTKEATQIIQEKLPSAVLLGILTKEIRAHQEFNVLLKRHEEASKEVLCAAEAPDFGCDLDIRRALSTVAGSLIDFPELDRAPISSDKVDQFIADKFFKKDDLYKDSKKTKQEIAQNCSEKLSLKKICKLRDERLKEIAACEKSKSGQGCLDNEQIVLASLLNDQKPNRSLFLAIEKELCLPTRVSKADSASQPSIYSLAKAYSGKKRTTTDLFNKIQFKAFSEYATNEEKKDQDQNAEKGTSPDARDVKKVEEFRFSGTRAPAEVESKKEEILGFESRDESTLSESFSTSLKDVFNSNKKAPTNSLSGGEGSWSNDFSDRVNAIAEEQKSQRNEDKVFDDKSPEAGDLKKNDEMKALTAQIDGLKAKLEEMTQKMDELKNKKEEDSSENKDSDKESSERQKMILDLKKKLSELEADKKKKEALAATKKEEEENAHIKARADFFRANSSPQGNYQARAESIPQPSEMAKREHESANNFSANASAGYGRAPAVAGATYGSQGASPIVLKMVGTQATPDSAVVYMTPNELQKYPFRLSDHASVIEIEKMLQGNNGATIILGDSEQIVPIMENGGVALDEFGKMKYKRVKISLVKSEKERKQNIAREISSVADLKREEQKKRDLIRYQEMKKSLKIK